MKYGPDYLAPGLLALALCSPVHANEPIGHGDPAPDWTGFYFGAALATPHGDNFWTVTNLTDHDLVPDRWDGEAAMLTFGHDWQRGRLTFGAMLSVGHGTISAMPGNVWNTPPADRLFYQLFYIVTNPSTFRRLQAKPREM